MAETEDGKKDVKKLAKNTGFLYLLSLSSQIVNLALIPFETRVLGSEAYGVIALSVAMSSIITIVLDFSLLLRGWSSWPEMQQAWRDCWAMSRVRRLVLRLRSVWLSLC